MKGLIDSRQLQVFASVARTKSFTAAAKELFLTQSAVSHAIKALEADLEVSVFDRVGKKAHLTVAGEQLIKRADRILRELQDARAEVEELQDWGHGRLRVGASTTACQYLLPNVLREFKQSFPECVIRIEPGDGPRMVELLRTNQVDLAVMLKPAGRDEMEFRPLFEDELRMYVSPIHPWAQHGFVTRRQLDQETFILYNKASYTFGMVNDYFRRSNVQLNTVIELGSMEAIKELVKIGLGVGVFAPWVAQKEVDEGSLVGFPLGTRKLKRAWGVSHLRGRKLALVEETFVGLCESVAETILLRLQQSAPA